MLKFLFAFYSISHFISIYVLNGSVVHWVFEHYSLFGCRFPYFSSNKAIDRKMNIIYIYKNNGRTKGMKWKKKKKTIQRNSHAFGCIVVMTHLTKQNARNEKQKRTKFQWKPQQRHTAIKIEGKRKKIKKKKEAKRWNKIMLWNSIRCINMIAWYDRPSEENKCRLKMDWNVNKRKNGTERRDKKKTQRESLAKPFDGYEAEIQFK